MNEMRSFVWSGKTVKSPTMTTEPEGLVNNAAWVIDRTAVAVRVAVHCSWLNAAMEVSALSRACAGLLTTNWPFEVVPVPSPQPTKYVVATSVAFITRVIHDMPQSTKLVAIVLPHFHIIPTVLGGTIDADLHLRLGSRLRLARAKQSHPDGTKKPGQKA